MNKDEHLLKIAETIQEFASEGQDEKLKTELSFLVSRLADPQTYVTFIGETSSGKSTIINGILKNELIKTATRPTTATVIQIQFSDGSEPEYFALNRDASLEKLDKKIFEQLSMEPDKKLLRLFVEYPFENAQLNGLNIFDTPGFNALNAEHEEVLREFIPNSDVIVFAVSYRVGFGIEDQRLMDLVGTQFNQDEAMPVLLVINRSPLNAGKTDKRVREIVLNANDSLHREVIPHIVYSVIPNEDNEEVPILPDTAELWKNMKAYALSAERLSSIRGKNRLQLETAADKMLADFRSRINAASLDTEQIEELNSEISQIRADLDESQQIVDKYMEILRRTVPKLFKEQTSHLSSQLSEEINDSSKWTDASLTAGFIAAHGLPFRIGKIVRQIEEYIAQQLERLDEEISEKANKTIQRINSKAREFQKPELKNLYKDLALKMGIQFGKAGANSFIKGLGGVGGAAAGAGNLLKMVVSRAGKLFGKTFSRQLYAQIGKVFTKEFLKRLNVALTLAVELIGFVWDANHWQNQLIGKVDENIDRWVSDSLEAFNEKMMPEYSEANHKLVEEIFLSLIQEIETEIHNIENKADAQEIAELQQKIDRINNLQKELELI